MTDYQIIEKILETSKLRSYRALAEFLGINRQIFYDIKAEKCGISRELTRIILDKFPNIPPSWLLGDFKESSSIQQTNTYGDNNFNGCGAMSIDCPNYGTTHHAEEVTVEEIRKPIIPTEWTYQPNVDIFNEVKNNIHKVAKSRFVALGIPIDLWHIVRDNSLAPRAYAGDYLGLATYPQGLEDPIWGKFYAVDTKTNGIIVRMLYPIEGGYRGEAPDRDKFPDIIIMRDNVISISRVVCVVRIAL